MTCAKTIDALGSWWLTAALLLAFCGACLFFSFGDAPYARLIDFIFHKPGGLALHLGLIANLLLATIRVVSTSLKRVPVSSRVIKAMDAWTEVAVADDYRLGMTAAWMKSRGFPGSVRGNALVSVKGGFSFIPGTILRLGLVILLGSLLAGAHLRSSTDALIHEGEEQVINGKKIFLNKVNAQLPRDFLQVGDESSFELDDVSADVDVSGGHISITPGFPSRMNGGYARIVHLGYSQQITTGTAGRRKERRVDLDLLPPGKTQIVTLPGLDELLTFSLQPEKTINKGLLTGKQYDLAEPFYRIVLQRGRDKSRPFAAPARPGDSVAGAPGGLSLGRHSLFINLRFVTDPALPAIYLGFCATLTGLLLMAARFFWYRKELVALVDGTMLYIGYQEEYFKKWGIAAFHRWITDTPLP